MKKLGMYEWLNLAFVTLLGLMAWLGMVLREGG